MALHRLELGGLKSLLLEYWSRHLLKELLRALLDELNRLLLHKSHFLLITAIIAGPDLVDELLEILRLTAVSVLRDVLKKLKFDAWRS